MLRIRHLLFLLLTLWTGLLQAGDPVPVDEAFVFEGVRLEGGQPVARWQIRDKYYLYRDRLKFTADGAEVVPQLPEAEIKDDPIFGKTPVYHEALAVPLKITGGSGTVALTIQYQGCWEGGVCYPPQTRQVKVTLPAQTAATPEPSPPASAAATTGESDNPLAALARLISPDTAERKTHPLPVEDAFRLESRQDDAGRLILHWTIAPDYYLYRDRIGVKVLDGDLQLGRDLDLPPAEIKDDPIFGKTPVYHDALTLTLDTTGSGTLEISYQGCWEGGVCYPPQKQRIEVRGGQPEPAHEASSPARSQTDGAGKATGSLPAITPDEAETAEEEIVNDLLDLLPAITPDEAETATDTAAAPAKPVTSETTAPRSETDQITDLLKESGFWVVIGIFFLLGLGLSLTPCVFPMIPILSSIIVGQGETMSPRRGFILSLVYVLAMALTYTVAGVLAGLFGANLQAALQHPGVLTVFALLFVALALSMFGFYELQLPAGLQNRLNALANRQQGGTLAGVAIMGVLSALIVGPCVAPPLAGALIYIGQTGDALLGGAALFAMSLGMGLPLIVAGTLGGRYLPKAGGWMETVKAVFGVVMLGLAIWILERILPAWLTVLLAAVLLIVSAIYMGALSSTEGRSGWWKLWKGLGLVMLIWGVLLLISVARGTPDLLTPLKGTGTGAVTTQPAGKLSYTYINTLDELKAHLGQGRPVLLDFYADWCVSCKEMERFTFSDPQVQQLMNQFVLLKADVTDNTAEHKALMQAVGVIGPPAILFYDGRGEELRALRVVGFKDAAAFRQILTEALAQSR